MAYRIGKAQFSAFVEQAISEVPEEFAAALEEVPLEIRDRPTAEQRKSVSLRDGNLLLGLYQGAPLTRRSVEAPYLPAVIYIFQEEIEAASGSEADLRERVRKTVLHEIGHHFGLNEDDLHRLGYG
jgi:predicted Zn-dependent protease with MMP-like domain